MNSIIDVILDKRFTYKQKLSIVSYRFKVYLKHIWGRHLYGTDIWFRRIENTIWFYFKYKSCFRAISSSNNVSQTNHVNTSYPKLLGKALFITFADNGTPYDYHNKIFLDAREALIFYRKVKAITKYKLLIQKITAYELNGRIYCGSEKRSLEK